MKKSDNSKVLYSEEQKVEAFNELNKTTNELRKIRKKKCLIIFSILILIIVVIKVFFGTIELNNIFGYPSQRARFYKVTINGKQISVNYNLKHKIPIIPFLINFNSYYLGNNIYGNDDIFFTANGSEKYIIDITSYSCYSNNYQVECKDSSQNMKENNDTKYTNLKITRTTNPYAEVYSGKYIDDISPYLKQKGTYCVEITAKYSLVETKIYFYFKNYLS